MHRSLHAHGLRTGHATTAGFSCTARPARCLAEQSVGQPLHLHLVQAGQRDGRAPHC
jgi:hypothetical protein